MPATVPFATSRTQPRASAEHFTVANSKNKCHQHLSLSMQGELWTRSHLWETTTAFTHMVIVGIEPQKNSPPWLPHQSQRDNAIQAHAAP